jgi:hypothetical protein
VFACLIVTPNIQLESKVILNIDACRGLQFRLPLLAEHLQVLFMILPEFTISSTFP